MKNAEKKYIYISNVNFDGTVFQTQVLDWLHLYKEHDLEFELIQAFPVKYLKNTHYISHQIKGIKKSTKLYTGTLYLLPSKGIYYIVNTLIIYFKLLKYLFGRKEVLIFSRAIIGKEISLLKKLSPAKVTFYFDGRAAAAEEQKYSALKSHNYSLKKYLTIANIYYLVYRTLSAADKIFVVSRVLQKYFQDTYLTDSNKFVLYPCLSDSSKFYLDVKVRNNVRESLNIDNKTKVFIYSGGFGRDWHISDQMMAFFDELFRLEKDSKLICLTIERDNVDKILLHFPDLKPHVLVYTVPNNQVYKYLNAADFGILFRENTIMNNVASPTKFAEYMLCGLPVLISDGVGDYSDYVVRYNLGVLVGENVLKEPEKFDLDDFRERSFDRNAISDFGKKNFSKNSVIENILEELKSC